MQVYSASQFLVIIIQPITLHGSRRTGQFLCWNRVVLYCVQETCTGKNFYQIDWHTSKFLVPEDLHKFLVQVSWACVAGISTSERHWSIVMRSFGGDTNELSSGSAVQSTSSTNLLIVHNILTVF